MRIGQIRKFAKKGTTFALDSSNHYSRRGEVLNLENKVDHRILEVKVQLPMPVSHEQFLVECVNPEEGTTPFYAKPKDLLATWPEFSEVKARVLALRAEYQKVQEEQRKKQEQERTRAFDLSKATQRRAEGLGLSGVSLSAAHGGYSYQTLMDQRGILALLDRIEALPPGVWEATQPPKEE